MADGWEESAGAWIADMGERGDYGREFVLDAPMMARIEGQGFEDITDVGRAIAEMARVLRPGGALLIANLTSFGTARRTDEFTPENEADFRFSIDHYLEERAEWVSWRGIHIRNWHRPLGSYMSLLLGQGLRLTHFTEPAPQGGDPAKAARYRRVPYLLMMEWRKP